MSQQKDPSTVACESCAIKRKCYPIAEWAKPVPNFVLGELLAASTVCAQLTDFIRPHSGAPQHHGMALHKAHQSQSCNGWDHACRCVHYGGCQCPLSATTIPVTWQPVWLITWPGDLFPCIVRHPFHREKRVIRRRMLKLRERFRT
jgi:hypothetical protein